MQKIPFGPIGLQVFKRTYSLKMADGRDEQWPDTVNRVVNGNLALVPEAFHEPDEREKLIGLLLEFAIMPAGRHLNSSGVKGRQFLFNCHAAGYDYAEPWAHFAFTFDVLMQGGGAGSNYSNRYLNNLPPVQRPVDLHITCNKEHPNYSEFSHLLSTHQGDDKNVVELVVEDSREGWVSALEALCRFAWDERFSALKEITLVVDVSHIRHRGAPLKTSGGIACGPGPLVELLTDFSRHLNGCVGRRLTSLDTMTLDHHIAEGVVAGGKRRSSRISVKNWADPDIMEFINCKRVDGAHWTTNISVEVDDEFFHAYHCPTHGLHEQANDVMRAVVLGKRLNGEPGLWNRSLAMEGERDPELMFCPNPCGEIGLQMWEACNLGHVNMEAFARSMTGKARMLEAFRLMARWLVRATYGDIPQRRQREVVDRNRRIGVGFMGFHAYLALNGVKYSESHKEQWVIDLLAACREAVKKEAASYATLLGIPVPVKNTALAPNGTGALLPGTTASGQCMMSPRYKRLVRYSSMDPELAQKKREGYRVFPDEDAKNTEIVEYWCEDPLTAKVRAAGFDVDEVLEGQYDISFENSLKVQQMLQSVYADNAVSYTINLPADFHMSEEQMTALLTEALPYLKGTTVFPNKSRKNAPFQPLTKQEWEAYDGRKEVFQVEDECRGGCPVR